MTWIAEHGLVLALLGAYTALMVYNAWIGQRRTRGWLDFFVAGRSLGGVTLGISFFRHLRQHQQLRGILGAGLQLRAVLAAPGALRGGFHLDGLDLGGAPAAGADRLPGIGHHSRLHRIPFRQHSGPGGSGPAGPLLQRDLHDGGLQRHRQPAGGGPGGPLLDGHRNGPGRGHDLHRRGRLPFGGPDRRDPGRPDDRRRRGALHGDLAGRRRLGADLPGRGPGSLLGGGATPADSPAGRHLRHHHQGAGGASATVPFLCPGGRTGGPPGHLDLPGNLSARLQPADAHRAVRATDSASGSGRHGPGRAGAAGRGARSSVPSSAHSCS